MKTEISKNRLAGIAGILYLVLIISGVFAHLYVRAKLYIPGDSPTTAQNIQSFGGLFRLGAVSDFVQIISFVFLALVINKLFKNISKFNTTALLSIVIITNAIMSVNMLNQFAATIILNGNSYLSTFNIEQLQALALFFMDLHHYGIQIGHLFFGLWLFPFGLLIYRSSLFSKIAGKSTGIMLMLGCISYIIDFLFFFLSPESYDTISSFLTIPADLGELSACVLLLYKGAISLASSKVN